MRGKISQSSAFRMLRENKERAKGWGVFAITKKGTIYKSPSVTCRTKEEAIRIQKRMEGLNHKPFIVKQLD